MSHRVWWGIQGSPPGERHRFFFSGMRWDGGGERGVAKLGGVLMGPGVSDKEDQRGPCDAGTKDKKSEERTSASTLLEA